ncbi:prepilin peptidase [Pseudomonas floridensis]|uniref:Prepilin peptidase n=1 Tax=Pseudomonas floridensis TaxID=1958950 RepID=A0A1X0N3U7_9PSED|nr:A24 family peptidase [Pseudomonas floridensis]ORC58198.1 prepilin peptidase [Pseudomonas floridensis]
MDLFFLLVWFAACAEQDARQREISNWLTMGVALLAGGYLAYSGHTWLGAAPDEAGWALLIALALTLPGYALGRLGAGDVKLLVALALATDSVYLLGTFIGAGLAIALWSLSDTKVWPLVNQHFTRRYLYLGPPMTNKYPFSPFLFIGLLLTVLIIH